MQSKRKPLVPLQGFGVFVGGPLADALALASELTYPDFNCIVPAQGRPGTNFGGGSSNVDRPTRHSAHP